MKSFKILEWLKESKIFMILIIVSCLEIKGFGDHYFKSLSIICKHRKKSSNNFNTLKRIQNVKGFKQCIKPLSHQLQGLSRGYRCTRFLKYRNYNAYLFSKLTIIKAPRIVKSFKIKTCRI